MMDPRQEYLRSFVLQERPLSPAELALKEAIESDPRVVVTALQVRRRYKTDPHVSKSFRRFLRAASPLILVFDFKCPCGETRREMFQIISDWHQPTPLKNLCERLRETVFEHLASEGLL